MIISPPFLPQSGLVSSDTADPDPMMTAIDAYASGYSGIYPVAFDRRWHGGVHLDNAPVNEPVRAIADGEVVAYRVSQSPISDGHLDEATGKEVLNTNTGFVLLRHVTETGAGRTLTYYSLYMHLLDLTAQAAFVGTRPSNPPRDTSPTALSAWLLEPGGAVTPGNGKRVYRKDILGYMGQSQGLRHLHFEIFMTQEDFTSWFNQAGHIVQVGHKHPVQPTCQDWWGHAYYIIPGSIEFVDRPGTQNDATWFPKLRAGKLANASSNLYVETYFHIGQRYMRAWIDENGDGSCRLLTQQPIKDPYDDYEYKLYERSMALYPGCPSDGYELLRFGRILSATPTLTSERDKTTWVAVPFDENGSLGYVDINRASIVKLSDADFPFFTGWRKIDGRDAPLDGDGLFSYQKLSKLFCNVATNARGASQTDQQFGVDSQLIDYIRNTDGVQESLRGFICESKSEWDPINNEARYRGLNSCDGYFGRCKETNPDGYEKFLGFVTKLQFLDQVPALSGGKRFWHFHPMRFIRHFRKCGWLSRNEMLQLIPASVIRKPGPHNSNHEGIWEHPSLQSAKILLDRHGVNLNNSMKKFKIDTPIRQACFIANVTQETGWFRYLTEGGRSDDAVDLHKGWFGRGFLQLTNPNGNMGDGNNNYYKYFRFLGRQPKYPPGSQEIAWRNEVGRDVFHASHSSATYWVWSGKSVPTPRNPTLPQVDSANRYADVPSINERRTIRTNSGNKVWYYNQSFVNCAAAVNYPGSTGRNPPNMNGLIDRSTSFTNALIVLTDVYIFEGPAQEDLIWPEDFSKRIISC